MIVSMIAAMARGRVIGLNGEMPWHLPADLAHFKRNTIGCPVIMGRKTFDSIGKALPGRKNIILSHSNNLSPENCEVVSSLSEALSLVENEPEVFIIGGQQLYQQGLALAQRLYLTHIETDVNGDTFFPGYLHMDWKQTHSSEYAADENNAYPYRFETLERVSTPSK